MPKTRIPAADRSTEHKIAHGCSLTVVTCMDWRGSHMGYAKLITHLSDVFKEPNVRFDHLSVPGACFQLVRGSDARRDALIDDIATAISLHGVETVMLVPHTSCGAYGKAMSFKDAEREKRILSQDIAKSASVLCQRFGPQLSVLGSIAHMDDSNIVGFELVYGTTKRFL